MTRKLLDSIYGFGVKGQAKKYQILVIWRVKHFIFCTFHAAVHIKLCIF